MAGPIRGRSVTGTFVAVVLILFVSSGLVPPLYATPRASFYELLLTVVFTSVGFLLLVLTFTYEQQRNAVQMSLTIHDRLYRVVMAGWASAALLLPVVITLTLIGSSAGSRVDRWVPFAAGGLSLGVIALFAFPLVPLMRGLQPEAMSKRVLEWAAAQQDGTAAIAERTRVAVAYLTRLAVQAASELDVDSFRTMVDGFVEIGTDTLRSGDDEALRLAVERLLLLAGQTLDQRDLALIAADGLQQLIAGSQHETKGVRADTAKKLDSLIGRVMAADWPSARLIESLIGSFILCRPSEDDQHRMLVKVLSLATDQSKPTDVWETVAAQFHEVAVAGDVDRTTLAIAAREIVTEANDYARSRLRALVLAPAMQEALTAEADPRALAATCVALVVGSSVEDRDSLVSLIATADTLPRGLISAEDLLDLDPIDRTEVILRSELIRLRGQIDTRPSSPFIVRQPQYSQSLARLRDREAMVTPDAEELARALLGAHRACASVEERTLLRAITDWAYRSDELAGLRSVAPAMHVAELSRLLVQSVDDEESLQTSLSLRKNFLTIWGDSESSTATRPGFLVSGMVDCQPQVAAALATVCQHLGVVPSHRRQHAAHLQKMALFVALEFSRAASDIESLQVLGWLGRLLDGVGELQLDTDEMRLLVEEVTGLTDAVVDLTEPPADADAAGSDRSARAALRDVRRLGSLESLALDVCEHAWGLDGAARPSRISGGRAASQRARSREFDPASDLDAESEDAGTASRQTLVELGRSLVLFQERLETQIEEALVVLVGEPSHMAKVSKIPLDTVPVTVWRSLAKRIPLLERIDTGCTDLLAGLLDLAEVDGTLVHPELLATVLSLATTVAQQKEHSDIRKLVYTVDLLVARGTSPASLHTLAEALIARVEGRGSAAMDFLLNSTKHDRAAGPASVFLHHFDHDPLRPFWRHALTRGALDGHPLDTAWIDVDEWRRESGPSTAVLQSFLGGLLRHQSGRGAATAPTQDTDTMSDDPLAHHLSTVLDELLHHRSDRLDLGLVLRALERLCGLFEGPVVAHLVRSVLAFTTEHMPYAKHYLGTQLDGASAELRELFYREYASDPFAHIWIGMGGSTGFKEMRKRLRKDLRSTIAVGQERWAEVFELSENGRVIVDLGGRVLGEIARSTDASGRPRRAHAGLTPGQRLRVKVDAVLPGRTRVGYRVVSVATAQYAYVGQRAVGDVVRGKIIGTSGRRGWRLHVDQGVVAVLPKEEVPDGLQLRRNKQVMCRITSLDPETGDILVSARPAAE